MVVACFVLILAFTASARTQKYGSERTEWTVKSALKQIDKATRGWRGVTAEAHWDEQFQSSHITGSARVHVRSLGELRGEVGGANPATVLVSPLYIHRYDPARQTVRSTYAPKHPDLLVQYVLLGFVPTGTALKKDFKVNLVREEVVDGRSTLMFTLVPRSEDLQAVIQPITLWIDTTTWLPAQQRIRHNDGGVQITVRYLEMTRADDLPNDLFRPDWPEGTRVIEH